MPIVPIYRLRATPSEPFQRYRFSRNAHPAPNPTPGKPDPDPETRWAVDRLAFYAWSDATNDRLVPVYEFYQLDEGKLVRYLYSTGPTPPRGWVSRDYVAFWMYPASAQNAGAPVYSYAQPIPGGTNHGLSVSPDLPEPWINESVLGAAAATVPVEVSLRREVGDPRYYHFTYSPSTINVSYPVLLHFGQAPRSPWRFTDLEILGGKEDFDPPTVTDSLVLVEARYTNPGQDFKYRLTIDVFRGPERLVSDPEVVNMTPDEL